MPGERYSARVTETSTRTSRKKVNDREALITAARSLIVERGLSDLRVSDVAERADLALGSFYRHFATKNELVDTVTTGTVAAIVESLRDLAERLDDIAEATSVAARALVGMGFADPEFARLVLHLEDSSRKVEQLIAPRAEPYFLRGVETGRFRVVDHALAVRMTIATILTGLRSVVEGKSGLEAAPMAAASALQALGIPHDEAIAIAALPLPELTAFPGGPLSVSARGHETSTSGEANGVPQAWIAEANDTRVSEYTLGRVRRLHIERPDGSDSHNVLTCQALEDGVRRAAADRAVGCVLVSGLKQLSAPAGADSLDAHATRSLVETLRSTPQPVVVMTEGWIAGSGAALAIAADQVVATRSTHFLPASLAANGSTESVALVLAARVGMGRATRMLMLSEPVTAPDALAAGLVDQLVEDGELEGQATDLARRLSESVDREAASNLKGPLDAVFHLPKRHHDGRSTVPPKPRVSKSTKLPPDKK